MNEKNHGGLGLVLSRETASRLLWLWHTEVGALGSSLEAREDPNRANKLVQRKDLEDLVALLAGCLQVRGKR